MINIKKVTFLLLCFYCFACQSSDPAPQSTSFDTNSPLGEETEALNALAGETTNEPDADTDSAVLASAEPANDKQSDFRYKLKKWSDKHKLNRRLREISGLVFDEQKNLFYAVNDEVGKIYILKHSDGEIVDIETFTNPGDFEDLTLHQNHLYVIKSNGRLYQLNVSDMKLEDKMDTGLSLSNDVEGLCYDPKSNRLLLACKGKSSIKSVKLSKDTRAVYAFDPIRKQLDKEPYLLIKEDDLKDYVEEKLGKKAKKKDLKKLLARVKTIAPSAIAIHPIEDNIYVLSSVGKMLVVYDRNGKVQHIEFLSGSVHEQPEGMSFASNGDLYISNEGKGGKGTIYRFKYR